jgi:hypothetical protein
MLSGSKKIVKEKTRAKKDANGPVLRQQLLLAKNILNHYNEFVSTRETGVSL